MKCFWPDDILLKPQPYILATITTMIFLCISSLTIYIVMSNQLMNILMQFQVFEILDEMHDYGLRDNLLEYTRYNLIHSKMSVFILAVSSKELSMSVYTCSY